MEASSECQRVVLGRIAGAYGIKGWVKVISETSPADNITAYPSWQLGREDKWQKYTLTSARPHGKGIVAKLDGVEDRDKAESLKGRLIAVNREELPQAAEGEYYWADLQGLAVRTTEGVDLGKVDYLFETGANDVLVVKGDKERLVPFIREQVIKAVDLKQGLITVDWDPDF